MANKANKLLLVDDEPDILETVKILIEMEFPGIDIKTAATGEAALVELRKQPFDLMVTDYRMPGMNGAELADQAHKGWPAMAILMITAYIDGKTLAAIKQQAPDLEVLPKPLHIEGFIGRIRAMLGERIEPSPATR